MNDKLKIQLDAIFNAYNEEKKHLQLLKSERERKEEAFLQAFYALQESTIRPTFEYIGEYIKTQGYEYRIDVRQESTGRDGQYNSPEISLRLLVDSSTGHHLSHEYPYFSVICEKRSQTVRFHESTMSPNRGGRAGGAGEAKLDEVTPELLQQKILNILRELFE